MENRPVGRKKNVGEGGSGVHRRGEGLGGGPVGGSGLNQGGSSGSGSGGRQRSGGGMSMFTIIIILLLVLGGGGGLTSMLGGGLLGGDTDTTSYTGNVQTAPTTTQTTTSGQSSSDMFGQSGSGLSLLGSMLGGTSSYSGNSLQSASWSDESNTGKLDTSVAPAARAKRTVIKGNGDDVFTIMVYMCGADLESRSGMATRDIQEMMSAKFGDNINLILYTGGAK